MKINQDIFDILDKVQKITLTDYRYFWSDAENLDGYVDSNTLFDMVCDLVCEVESMQELIEELRNKENEEYEYDPHDIWLDHKEGII